ncbi:MAG: thioredoxin-dependent thiol peroxidase, partial [Candidatus Micrarchaeota archaeon]|nr:thioredoxin-dependent thiol peroxidase [Candidatus Micrarchaeota archaeon]
MGRLKAGEKAPDFALPDAEGKMRRLAEFLGKKLVLYFYPKDDTPGCTVEACDFTARQDKILAAGAAVVGVSPQDGKSHQKFISKYGLKHLLLCDTDHAVAEKYGVWGKKKFMGREYMGIERSTFVIDEKGRIRRAMYGVNPAGHADGILEILAGK